MAISFIGSIANTHANTIATTVDLEGTFGLLNSSDVRIASGTLQEGDMILIGIENASTVNRSTGGGPAVLVPFTPSGYTGVGSHDYRDDSNDSNFRVSYKFMGPTPDTSVDIPASNANSAGVAYGIIALRGVDPTNPLDVAAVITGATNTAVANAAAITPVTAGAWVAVFAGAAAAAGAVFTRPANLSATTGHFRTAVMDVTNDAVIGFGLKTDWASGAFDPDAFGGSTATNTGSWSAATLALRPYTAPAPGGARAYGFIF